MAVEDSDKVPASWSHVEGLGLCPPGCIYALNKWLISHALVRIHKSRKPRCRIRIDHGSSWDFHAQYLQTPHARRPASRDWSNQLLLSWGIQRGHCGISSYFHDQIAVRSQLQKPWSLRNGNWGSNHLRMEVWIMPLWAIRTAEVLSEKKET